jgi:anti-sigma factor RsiW
MLLADSDLELLESYLDGELSVAEDEALRDRMNIEPALASALENLRAERDARRSAFSAMEPDDATVERFNRHASREIQRLDREFFWQRTSKTLRIVSAAAACLVIGFSIGRIADSGVLNHQPGDRNRPSVAAAEAGANAVEVVLTDDRGQEIGVQRFPTREKANEFIHDCDSWQQRQRLLHDANVIMTSQEEPL